MEAILFIGLPASGKSTFCNAPRVGDDRVVETAVLSKAKQLELPQRAEGFDRLFSVRIEGDQFVVEEWQDEVQ